MVRFKSIHLLTAIVFAIMSYPAGAKQEVLDLGTAGDTYPVKETDFSKELQEHARHFAEREKDQPLFERLQVYQPYNLHPLPPAEHNRSFTIDMSYVLDQEIVDNNGGIVFPKGYIFNPLKYISLQGGLVIIDGTDPEQIEWFRNSPYRDNRQAKLFLSDGSAFTVTHQLKRPAFYLTDDIARRLKLSAVPSIIVQKGRALRVHEIKLSTESK